MRCSGIFRLAGQSVKSVATTGSRAQTAATQAGFRENFISTTPPSHHR